MRILVDELPALGCDCLFFRGCDCQLDGTLCKMWRKEHNVGEDVECEYLKEFKPFVFEPEFRKAHLVFEEWNRSNKDV